MHFLRFATARSSDDTGELDPPDDTRVWLAMVDRRLGENLWADRVGTVWGIVGLHENGDAADRTVRAASSTLPLDERCIESWHGSFDVMDHRGAVDWLDSNQPGLAWSP
jgi:hypothetical protein